MFILVRNKHKEFVYEASGILDVLLGKEQALLELDFIPDLIHKDYKDMHEYIQQLETFQ